MVKANMQFFSKEGLLYRVRVVGDYYFTYEHYRPDLKLWIQVMNPGEISKFIVEVERGDLFLDTPSNRILYGKNLPL